MSRSSNTPATPVSNPASAQGVPDGWKLVPIEPTPEMIHIARFGAWGAARIAIGEPVVCGETPFPNFGEEKAREVYRAMLFASPAPSQDAALPASGGVREVRAREVAELIERLEAAAEITGDDLLRDAITVIHVQATALSPVPETPSPVEAEALPAGVDVARKLKLAANSYGHSIPDPVRELMREAAASLSSAPAPEERADG